ncbi:MAG: hypothetical protein II505_01830 [Bacteroidaceae bacterium]|nr:hypothetical protein [Bacteroidaceae bacterium]
MMTVDDIFSRAREVGIRMETERFCFRIPGALQLLRGMLDRLTGGRTVWHEEYDEVADWLSFNRGRGLLLMGRPGLGKSLLCERVIPALVYAHTGICISSFSASDLCRRWDDVSRMHRLCIDDVGVEPAEVQRYGTTQYPFSELVDTVEREGRLLLATTNLTTRELLDRYGVRTVDRLRSTVRVVVMHTPPEVDTMSSSHRGMWV